MLRDFNYFVIRAGNLIYSYKYILNKCFRLNGTNGHYRYTKEDQTVVYTSLIYYHIDQRWASQVKT